ncbi:MAG: hypothetical protein Q8936_22095, partial [Bacillota bacterium]|nr:hypothetical protein [Bacillota bacterium]
KKCMLLRLKYIEEKCKITSIAEYYSSYEKIEKKALLIRNLVIKSYMLKDNKASEKIKRLLKELEAEEEYTLREILKYLM